MNKIAVVTIITPDYIPYADTVLGSVISTNHKIEKYAFISHPKVDVESEHGISFLFQEDLADQKYYSEIHSKYFDSDKDAYRWSLKPVVLKYLTQKYDMVFFLDPDLFFYQSFDFLIEMLRGKSVLLSPHFRSFDPNLDAGNFYLNFMEGLYNGGFIGITKTADHIMDWWAEACHYSCSRIHQNGLYVDQKYLDAFPALFSGVVSISHRGCNIANWNQIECKRNLQSDGSILINDEFPVVFIHFTKSTINGILNYGDSLLIDHLENYNKTLGQNGLKFDLIEKYKIADIQKPFLSRVKNKIGNTLNFLR